MNSVFKSGKESFSEAWSNDDVLRRDELMQRANPIDGVGLHNLLNAKPIGQTVELLSYLRGTAAPTA